MRKKIGQAIGDAVVISLTSALFLYMSVGSLFERKKRCKQCYKCCCK